MAKNQRQVVRPPAKRKKPIRTAGSEIAGLTKPTIYQAGPGDPPLGFVNQWSSKSEWIVYWALSKIFGDPADPRQSPFQGGARWTYQTKQGGGRNTLGGQVIDFVVYTPGLKIGIWLQSDRFHLAAGVEKTAFDIARMEDMSRYMKVVALYERDLITDATGQQAIKTIVDALGGKRRIDPKQSGTYYPTRQKTAA